MAKGSEEDAKLRVYLGGIPIPALHHDELIRDMMMFLLLTRNPLLLLQSLNTALKLEAPIRLMPEE